MTEDNKTVKDISLDIPRSLDSHLYDTMMYINIQNWPNTDPNRLNIFKHYYYLTTTIDDITKVFFFVFIKKVNAQVI